MTIQNLVSNLTNTDQAINILAKNLSSPDGTTKTDVSIINNGSSYIAKETRIEDSYRQKSVLNSYSISKESEK